MSFNDLISAIGPVLPDNTSVALDIESTDGANYVTINTTNGGSEELVLKGGGTAGLKITQNNQVRSTVGDGWVFVTNDPTDTVPNICPSQKDLDTGIGHGDAGNTNSDQLSLIAGGVEGIRITESGGAAVIQFGQDNYDPEIQQGSGSNMGYTFKGDTNTGMSSGGASDTLYLTAGSTTGIQITEEIPSGGVTSAVVKMKDAIQYNSGTGSDTANTEPVYLADTNGTMIVDFSNGNFGDITLAANVTAVKFFNVPADGTTATITAKITQDSSVRTFDYSDSAVTVYSDYGSTAVTGEIKFAGGAHHVQSTGSGAVDLVSFTCIPSGSTFNIYAAVIGQAFA